MVLGLVAVLAAVAALGVARQGPSSSSREHELSKLLIQQSDLPSGWVPVPPTSLVAAPQIACLTGSGTVSASSPGVVVATAYRAPAGIPNVIEQIEKYTPPGAAKRLSELQGIALHGCPGPSQAANQSGLVFSPARVLTSPTWGDASSMYSIDIGHDTNVVVFVGRLDGYVVLTQVESRVPVNARVVSALVTTAMARVRALG